MTDQPQKGLGIHITADPDHAEIAQSQKAEETVQRSLRLLLVSDLAPQTASGDGSGPAVLHRVDPHRFDAFIQQMAPRLVVKIPNKISESPRMLKVDLTFSSLKAFHPEQVVQQIPELAQLLAIRMQVGQVRRSEIDLETLKTRLRELDVDSDWVDRLYQLLAEPAPPVPPPAPASSRPSESPPDPGDALDRIFEMVDAGEEEPEPVPPASEATVSDLVEMLVGAFREAPAARQAVSASAIDLLLADLDQILNDQLDALFNHPAFRQVEASWRGLAFLVRRINFRKNIRLDVLTASREDLCAVLNSQVFEPELPAETVRPAPSVLLLDFAFDHGRRDLEDLYALAEGAARLQVPLIASASPAFFGVEAYTDLDGLPPLRQHFAEAEFIAWNKFRNAESSYWLSLALPPFLLRPAYGPDTQVQAFAFEETGWLWGSSALAVAVVVADRFAETGWPTLFSGYRGAGLEDLPIWKSRVGFIPLSALFTESKYGVLAEAGFVVLGCKRNHDAAYVVQAPVVHRAGVYTSEAATQQERARTTLEFQLFLAQASHGLMALRDEIASDPALVDTPAVLEARLRSFLRTPGQTLPDDTVSVVQVEEAGQPARLAVRLKPPRSFLRLPINLVMTVEDPSNG